MGNTVFLTLGEAAKATGKAKTTIQRAVKSGKVSGGSRGVNGEYQIDPSELFRVYPAAQHATGSRDSQMERDATPEGNTSKQGETAALERVIAAKDEQIAELKAGRDRALEDKEREARIADELRSKVERVEQQLLTYDEERSKPEPPKRRWWQLGKG